MKAEAERMHAENATFAPRTNKKIARDNMEHFSVGKGEEGMRKYLMRQEQARELKAEKQQIEQKVFRTGQNWRPTPTVPKTPKISAAPVKGERIYEHNVKSLSKPVNSIRR
mmetsp:Transcript_856/g.1154  ORF Transcript_856/g.1154 Transcript_856/m.1154 type:complete len:111 (+) Transcript_856:199-531(+)